MDRYAAAYVRRSSVSDNSPGEASLDAQLAAVRSLCGEDVTIYKDWGISGMRANRPDYLRLKRDIAAGLVDSVCAYSLSRLGRKTKELLEFVDLCNDAGVTIRTKVESLDTATAMGRAMLTVMAAFAQLEAESGSERSRAAMEAKRLRGDALGRPGWGFKRVQPDASGPILEVPDPDMADQVRAVLDTFREAGTILGAVRSLNERAMPAPKGGEWHTSVLTRIVDAHAPELRNGHRGKGRPAGPAMLGKLVRCHCGQIMTPNAKKRQLYCSTGNRKGVAAHGRAHVLEADIFPWIMNESMKVQRDADLGQRRANAEQRQAELDEQRTRLGFALTDGHLTREDARARAKEINDELTQIAADLATMGDSPDLGIYEMPEMDPAIYKQMRFPEHIVLEIQRHLRSLIRHVQLDAQMRPVSVEWASTVQAP